jgi:hypothetical protein
MAFPDAYDSAVLGGAWPSWLGTSESRVPSAGVYWPFDEAAPNGTTIGTEGTLSVTASSGVAITQITLNSPGLHNKYGNGAVLQLNDGAGHTQNVTISIAANSSTTIGQTVIPISSVTPSHTYSSGSAVNNTANYLREASGNYPNDPRLWWVFSPGFHSDAVGQPAILPMPGARGSMHSNGTGEVAVIAYVDLDLAQQAIVQPQSAFTMCTWIQLDNLLGQGGDGASYFYAQFFGYSCKIQWAALGISNASGPATGIVPTVPFFLAHTWDGSANSIGYINAIPGPTQVHASMPVSTNQLELCSSFNTSSMFGYQSKLRFFTSVLTPGQLQNLYMIGAQTFAESVGNNLNVYPFMRQVVAANGARNYITLQNPSNTPMCLYLGTNAAAASSGFGPNQGSYLPPNGGKWTSWTYKGAIQVCHTALAGSRTLLIEQG